MNKLTAKKCRKKIEMWSLMQEAGTLAEVYEMHLQAYRIALPVLEQQERGEGEWVEWGGGPVSPVSGVVEVRWSSGSTDIGYARDWRWEHSRFMINIIAYRIISERATNQNGGDV
ncbi:hypothetical protein [Pantoea sp. GABEPS69]|uniref:hypothetical protein n=1 Tax=Pantoea sp. GABEPS69 TaxID=3028805 RepID=UPI0038912A1F